MNRKRVRRNERGSVGRQYARRERRSDNRSRDRWAKVVLVVGFCALAAAAVVAHTTPATGYELSIYRGTPFAFWVAIAIAFLCALVSSFAPSVRKRTRLAALVLAGSSGVAIAAIPITRGYYFYGAADSLTHLGWVMELVTGVLDPYDFLYPGVHLIAVGMSEVGGVGRPRALQYAVLCFVPVYLVFVPLCVRVMSGHEWALPVGLFSALLFLPITNVSTFLEAHPTTQAILFTPFVLYCLFQFVADKKTHKKRGTIGDGGREMGSRQGVVPETLYDIGPITTTGTLLALGSVGILLVHPQQAVNVLLIYASIVAVQFVCRRYGLWRPIASHRPLYAQTAFLAVAFVVWAASKERVSDNTVRILDAAIAALSGATVPADEVAQRSTSLAILGGSIEELFVKLFMIGVVFAGLAGLFMLVSLTSRYDDGLPDRNALGKYFTVAFVPLVGVFVVLFVSSHTTQDFRQVGFILMVATVLGSVLVVRGIAVLSRSFSRTQVLAAVGLCFVITLPISIATVYNSPYVYQPSGEVTDTHLSGYEAAFEHRSGGIPYAGIHEGPEREVHAVYGPAASDESSFEGVTGPESSVPPSALRGRLSKFYEGERYVTVTNRDRKEELALYGGLRYSREEFRSFESAPGVSRVQSNGYLRVWFVPPN